MNLAEVITALATTGAAVAAWEALRTWRKQLQGSRAHEIAWKYLEATLHLRDAINYGVRNPFISISEIQKACEEYYGKEKDIESSSQRGSERGRMRAVYATRWKEIDQARHELRTAKIQAEIWWGEQILNFDKPLNELIGNLYIQVKRITDPERGLVPEDDILYFTPDRVTEFDSKLNGAVKKVDEWMRPHIRYEYEEIS